MLDLCHVGNFCTGGDYFYCGNFGLLLLDQRHAGKVAPTLLQMMRVVACAGLSRLAWSHTWPTGIQEGGGLLALATGNTCTLIQQPSPFTKASLLTRLAFSCHRMHQSGKGQAGRPHCTAHEQDPGCAAPEAIPTPQLFQGHTRFATSSISTLPAATLTNGASAQQLVWEQDAENGKWVAFHRNTNVTSPTTATSTTSSCTERRYPLEDVQTLLVAMLHSPLPATVDSACIAGLLDLLRTAGMWKQSVRYAYVFGVLGTQPQISLTPIAKSGLFWDPATLSRATKVFETAWNALLGDLHGDTEVSVPELRVQMLARLSSGQAREVLQKLPLPPFFDPLRAQML